MQNDVLADAIACLEKANADLAPELLSTEAARERLAAYARAEKLAAYGKTVLARKIDNAEQVARVTGTSMGKAKATLETAKALRDADAVSAAFGGGEISFEQASEIARAEKASPGAGSALLEVAQKENFHVLRHEARKVVLEAERHRDLSERQREARSARPYIDPLGMVNIYLRLEPHVGMPLVNRAEAQASRLYREAKRKGRQEPFERHLADAYAQMLSGSPVMGNSKRPELVVVVSHEVAKRGWTDVSEGEVCQIPGVGPVTPSLAREIAQDAFLTGLFYDGKDLRNIKRWTRDIPIELRIALELGEPPGFDGIDCVDCGNRFRNQNDHVEPRAAGGPLSLENSQWRCPPCHKVKTERDRKAGKLKPRAKGPPP